MFIHRTQWSSMASPGPSMGHPWPSNGDLRANPSGRSRWRRDRDRHLTRTCCTRAVSRWGSLSILTPSGSPRTSRWVSSPRPSGSAATSSRSASRACSRPACMQWSMSAYHIRQPREMIEQPRSSSTHQRQSSECSSEAIKRVLIRGNPAKDKFGAHLPQLHFLRPLTHKVNRRVQVPLRGLEHEPECLGVSAQATEHEHLPFDQLVPPTHV